MGYTSSYMKVSITFHGGAGAVTGSNFLLEVEGKKALIDCGLVQSSKFCDACNKPPFPYDPASIDTLIVTHAHIDHVGRIPLLLKEGFKGGIYSTIATRELAHELLLDAVEVMRQERRNEQEPLLYEEPDVERCFNNWKDIPYHAGTALPGGLDFSFGVSGHILGSALVKLIPKAGGKTLLFTGDLGNPENPILPAAETPEGVSFLVMESVYGNRLHEDAKDRMHKLESIIRRVIRQNGTLLIPAFAAERTQDLLFDIHELMRGNRVPHVPVFVDSPLAIRVTEIYRTHPELYQKEVEARVRAGEKIFAFPGLTFTEAKEESQKIESVRGAKIVIAGSGMSHGGRVLAHEAKLLPQNQTTLLLVGYQAAGSLGRRLQEGAHEVMIDDVKIPVHASVETLFGYSAHMDRDQLLSFAEAGEETLEKVFVVMGEPAASLYLAQRISGHLGMPASVPQKGDSVSLEL